MIVLSPKYRLYIEGEDQEKLLELNKAFAQGSAKGLLFLDTATDALTENPIFAYWKDFARLYLSLFTATVNLETRDLKNDPVKFDLHPDDISRFLATTPPMRGGEYINEESLSFLWDELGSTLQSEVLNSGKSISDYFVL